jgi:hypothetical protein
MDDAQFDAEALAIIRPSWADRGRYPDAAAQVAALRQLADRRAAWLARTELLGRAGLTDAARDLTARILGVLEAEEPLPVSTPALLDCLKMRGHHGTVLRMLNRLARLGEVEKWAASGDTRCCYWRRLTGLES